MEFMFSYMWGRNPWQEQTVQQSTSSKWRLGLHRLWLWMYTFHCNDNPYQTMQKYLHKCNNAFQQVFFLCWRNSVQHKTMLQSTCIIWRTTMCRSWYKDSKLPKYTGCPRKKNDAILPGTVKLYRSCTPQFFHRIIYTGCPKGIFISNIGDFGIFVNALSFSMDIMRRIWLIHKSY